MTIIIGADHAATRLKESLKRTLTEDGHAVNDVSPTTPEGSDDYPDYAFRVAEAVVREQGSLGILLCDTGIGMAIAANKVPGAFAALVTDTFGARRAREHNNANILVLGSEFSPFPKAIEYARVFIATPFTDADRHVRRIGKIRYYDEHRQSPS